MMKTFETKNNNTTTTSVLDEKNTIRELMSRVSQLEEENTKLKACFENATEEEWEYGPWEYGPWVEEEEWEYEDDLPELESVSEDDEA